MDYAKGNYSVKFTPTNWQYDFGGFNLQHTLLLITALNDPTVAANRYVTTLIVYQKFYIDVSQLHERFFLS